MGMKRLALAALGRSIKGALALAGRRSREVAQAEPSKALVPVVAAGLPGSGALKFLCPNETAVWRARTLPTHVKIDIDGIKGEIVARTGLKSALIEMDSANEPACGAVIARLGECGLDLVERRQARRYRNGPYANEFNYIFRRQAGGEGACGSPTY